MSNKEKIIDKITKLMQKAHSAKAIGSVKESEAFLAKANELLIEYNIEESQIDLGKGTQPLISMNTVSFHDNQAGSRWRLAFITTLVQYNLCQLTTRRTGVQKFANVIGKQQNVDVVIYLYQNIGEQLLRLAIDSYKKEPSWKKEATNRYAYLKDWLLGAAHGFYQKLEVQKQEQQMKYGESMTGLVLYNKEAIDNFKAVTWPKLKPARKAKVVYVDEATYEKGVKVGKEVGSNKAMEAAQQQKQL